MLNKLEIEKKKFEEELNLNKKEIPVELVYDVVSNMTKIPVNKLNSDESKQLSGLEDSLNEKVIGQSEAVSKISNLLEEIELVLKTLTNQSVLLYS